jgi:hypothetical protein
MGGIAKKRGYGEREGRRKGTGRREWEYGVLYFTHPITLLGILSFVLAGCSGFG